MAEFIGPNISSTPLSALRIATRETISSRLNPTKVIHTEDGLPRDWRGLAHVAGLVGDDVSQIGARSDPTGQVLRLWRGATLGHLTRALGQIDRYDVIDDTALMFEQDADKYASSEVSSYSSAPTLNADLDKQILTVDDVSRLERGLSPQSYDAFLLFDEEDIDFASEVVENMEGKYHLKLCIRDRDLVGGLTFEHEAIMRLISERCNRLIVIVSPSFLKSEANKFFVTFAQALGIEQRRRKVVPCLYKRCTLPPELSYYFLLDYTRSGILWDFWAKMRDSLQTPVPRSNALSIKEVEEDSKEILKVTNNPQDTSHLYSLVKTKDRSDNVVILTTDSNHSKSMKDNVSTENLKPKSGKWLRRLLPKQKSKKKKKIAEAL